MSLIKFVNEVGREIELNFIKNVKKIFWKK
jgi:hypothetical protein